MDRPTPPIRTSSEPTGAPPSAPVQNRKPGRPFGRSTSPDAARPPVRTGSEPAPELLALLPSPSPADLKATRIAAGHTQSQAAATIGMRRWATWSDYEGGIRHIPPLAWTWYLLATGAHPIAELRMKPKSRLSSSLANSRRERTGTASASGKV